MAKLKSGTRIYGTATIDTSVVVGSAVTLSSSGIQVTGIVTATSIVVSSGSTFTNGPILIGSGTSTGTASQSLQVTGGAYVSGNIGIGTTNPTSTLQVQGTVSVSSTTTSSEFVGGGSNLRNLSGTHLVSYASHSETSNSALSIAGISTYNQVGILTGSLAVDANDNFGYSIATSADGKTIVVGAPNDEIGATSGTGVAYVFNRQGNTFNQVGILTGSLAVDANDNFGYLVATSADGKTIVVGAYNDEIGATGSTGVVYVFDQTRETYVYSGPTGNIGIGTTNPTSKLSVVGDSNVTGIITSAQLDLTASATASDSVLYLSGTPTSSSGTNGLFGIGALNFSDTDIIANFKHNVNSYAQLVVQNTNSGTSASSDIIVNNDRTAGTTYYGDFGINGTTFAGGGAFGDVDGTYLYSAGGTLSLGSLNSYDVKIATNNTERVRVSAGGSVGIGTTNPLQKLHVLGNLLVAAGSSTGQHITQKAYELNSGTLSWEGSAGQLFSITNNLTSGSIFSVNDVSGIPSIDVNANGTVSMVAYGGNLGVGTTNPTSKLHVNGQITSTQANSTTTGGGQIYLNGTTGNRIDFNQSGAAAPTTTTRSVGTKIVLYPNLGASQVDYALGIDNSTFWYSATDSNASFKWYAGTTNIATLSGAGALSVTGTVSGTNITTGGNVTGSSGSVANAATFNNGGAGAVSGTTFNGSAAQTISYNTLGASPLAGSSSLVTTGTVTSGTWSASFGAVSGANLTSLTAGNLSGTIPSGVLGNSTHYIGTTAILLNRASASQSLTGINIDGSSGSCTGNAATATKVNSQGDYSNASPGTTRGASGLNFYQVYSNGYPTTYGNLLHVYGAGAGQLLIGWSGTDGAQASNYVRSKRDNDSGAWSAWAEILTSTNYNSYAPTLTGTGASGSWGISVTGSSGSCTGNAATATTASSCSGNAATATTASSCSGNAATATNLSTGRTNWSTNGTIAAVVGQLSWKNYGNNHTIFDASNSTSPDGGAVNNTNSQVAWTSTYPTLMGWNGTNTYGVRVDSARIADSTSGSSASCSGNSATATNISNSGTVTLATATESNSIYITAPSYTTDQPVKLLNFDWYGNLWSLGNIRSASTPSNGFGVYSSGTERARFTTSGLQITNSFGVGTAPSGTTGEIRATNNVTAYYSDERLKENIKPITSALSKLLTLRGVTFNSNKIAEQYGYEDKKEQVGVIAQDVEKVLPQVVVPAPFDIAQDEDGNEYSKSGENYKTVHYDKLVPLLIEAIKEQSVLINSMQNQIDELKSKISI